MDYEKKYNDAMNLAKSYYGKGSNEFLDTIFPELRESDDERNERIRKAILGLSYLDGIEPILTKCSVTRSDIRSYLEKQKEPENVSATTMIPSCWEVEQKEQKPTEYLKAENDNWYICIKDFYAGGKKWASVGDLVQAKNGMYMMGRDDISEWFRRAYFEEVRDAFEPNADTNIPEQPTEWSEEDERMYKAISIALTMPDAKAYLRSWYKTPEDADDWLKSLFLDHKKKNEDVAKLCSNEWSEEDEEAITTAIRACRYMTENFENSTKQYEDAIERLKSLRPSWKPSEEQMDSLRDTIVQTKGYSWSMYLPELYEHLKKLGVKEDPEYYQHFDPDC